MIEPSPAKSVGERHTVEVKNEWYGSAARETTKNDVLAEAYVV